MSIHRENRPKYMILKQLKNGRWNQVTDPSTGMQMYDSLATATRRIKRARLEMEEELRLVEVLDGR